MKKIAVLLLLAILSGCILTACNDASQPNKETVDIGDTSESTKNDTPTTDDDSSTNKPPENSSVLGEEKKGYTMIKTTYETDNRIIAKTIFDETYMADPTGKKDNTVKLQYAISECAKNGGGVLFIPAGQYLIKGTVVVPLGVVICGDWQNPNEADPKYGTVILADTDTLASGAARDSKPLFQLSSNAGIIGLTIYYPNQDSTNVKPYGFSIYFKDGTYNYTNTLKNITLINSYRGISMGAMEKSANERHGTHQIENVYMCALETGVEMHGSMDTGFATGIHISPKYWTDAGCGYNAKATSAANYALASATGFVLGDLDCDMFADISVSSCKIGINFKNITEKRDSAFWGNIYGVDIRNCRIGINVEQISAGNSALIANGYVEGSEYALKNNQKRTPVRLCNITLKGAAKGYYLTDDSFIPSGYSFKDYKAGTHFKPAEEFYVVDTQKYDKTLEDFGVELQKVLDEAAKTGGVVYIPAGVYSIYTQVTVPEGVQLLGAIPILQRDTEWRALTGTVLLSYVGDKATIVLGKNAGIVGMRIWSMTVSAPKAFEMLKNGTAKADIPCIKGNGSGVYVTDTIIIGAFVSIDFTGCDNHVVDHILGEAYSSLVVAGGKNGYIGQCHANAFATDNSLSAYFDTRYVNKSEWTTAQKPNNDAFQRVYRTTYRLVNAENEYVVNCGNYAARRLFDIKSSTATLINVAIDTLLGTNEMFNFTDSTVNVANAMRVYGTSLKIDATSNVCILNRDDRLNVSEKPYNSAVERVDDGVREYEGEDVHKVIVNCDTKPSSGSGTIVTSEHKEGSGAWKFENATSTLFSHSFSTPVDISSYADMGGYLHMWIYVEDVEKFKAASDCELELTSSGRADVQEINWTLTKYITQSGWTELYLPFDTAEITLGSTSNAQRGEFKSEALNFMRLYVAGNEANTYMIDDVYVCMTK